MESLPISRSPIVTVVSNSERNYTKHANFSVKYWCRMSSKKLLLIEKHNDASWTDWERHELTVTIFLRNLALSERNKHGTYSYHFGHNSNFAKIHLN